MKLTVSDVLKKQNEIDSIIENNGNKITIRQIDNGDKMVFVELQPNCEFEFLSENDYIQALDFHYKPPPKDIRYGESKISGWQCLVTTGKYEFILSKQYIYKELSEGNSKIRELLFEKSFDLDLNKSIKASNLEYFMSFSFVITNDKLFESENSKDAYLKMFYEELYAHNAACSVWYMPTALNTKLATSVIPAIDNGYQVSIHHSSKKELIHLYRTSNDRLLYALLFNAAYTVINCQPRSDGMFLTTFTSSWLNNRYKICAPYIDTRLNETFFNAYSDIQDLNNNFKECLDLNYADFLSIQLLKGNIYKSENGYFFPDYFPLNSNILTHTSLNHQMGIATYFLKTYKKYRRQDLLKNYQAILDFLRDTYSHWINKENGDLFYEIMPTNNGWVYQSKDYVYVTLNDLLTVLKNHREFFKNDLPFVVELIGSKVKFLDSIGMGIFDSYSPAASGEGVSGKFTARKLIRENLLDNLAHKDYCVDDNTFTYEYLFDISISPKMLKKIKYLQYIDFKNSIFRFNNPSIFHWNYALKVSTINDNIQTGYKSEPSFQLQVEFSQIQKIDLFVQDMDSKSPIVKINLTPKHI